MMSVLANTAQRLCQLALMRGEPAAAQRAVLEQRQLDGRKRKSRNLGFLRIFGDFLCGQKVTRRRQSQPIQNPIDAYFARIFQNLYKTPLFFPSRARYNMNGHTESLTDKKEAAWKN